jgi:hypothetical protein
MGNSRHSVGFIRLFDAVVGNCAKPLQERLVETWQEGDDLTDATKELAKDLLHIGATLQAMKQGMSREQVAFMGDLYDHAIGRVRFSGATVEEHKTQFNLLAQDEFYWEPPIVNLNLLRGYDALHKTSTARMYKDFLIKLINLNLTSVERATPKDNQILEEFERFWTEVVTATRTPYKCVKRESSALIADLNKAVGEFIGPARDVIRAVDELKQMPSLRDTEGFIRRTFTNYCAQAILVDSKVDQHELELFHDLAPTLMFFGKQGSIENLRALFQGAAKNISPTETPLLVSILEIADKSMNTELADRARSLYFRLANTAFKSDMTVDAEEMAWLAQFKATLYPHGTAENLEKVSNQVIEIPSSDPTPVVGDTAADQCLRDLNTLVGLDKAKKELAQLVNFIKVQKMRQEKGMPGSAIPRHLVFAGNPGTGKASVARILGKAYRLMGVLKKGLVIEVNCADLVTGSPGQTGNKIRETISSHRGNIIFLNEAGALLQEDSPAAMGKEALDTLVRAMDDHRDAVVVVLAGRPEEMEKLLNANSVLKMKFNKTIVFEDYTPDQMLELYKIFCLRGSFATSRSAHDLARKLFEQLYEERDESWANARDIRRIFEAIIGNQANRIISLPHVNEEILSTIMDEDVLPIVSAFETSKI